MIVLRIMSHVGVARFKAASGPKKVKTTTRFVSGNQ